MIKSYRPWYIDIAGLLVAESAFHVGTGESLNPDTDSPAARRDGAARNGLILPGSSLKGVLRSFMNRECGTVGCTREDVQRLFGSASGKSGSQGWLTILDAVATELSPSSEKRDHVRIDRRYGAAADGAKFDEEAGVNGTTFDFRAIYEGENDAKCFRLMNLAFEALTRSELRVGAGQSRGFGKVRLEALPSCRVFRRDTVEGLQTFVAYRVEQDTASETVVWPSGLGLGDASPLSCPSALSTLSVNLAIHCEGPVLVRAAPREHEQTDAEFFASAGKKVLPGSSLRGVCRSRAEKICNTLGWPVSRVEDLFGSARDDGSGRRGLLEFADGPVREGTGQPLRMDHVAIDRITGFAADGKKFAANSLQSPVFESAITVRFSSLHLEALDLLVFILRDLIEPYRMWIGSGTTRGYGKVARSSVRSVAGRIALPSGRECVEEDSPDLAKITMLFQRACARN